jgi:hypothetical protein
MMNDFCFVCEQNFQFLKESERTQHINQCLDGECITVESTINSNVVINAMENFTVSEVSVGVEPIMIVTKPVRAKARAKNFISTTEGTSKNSLTSIETFQNTQTKSITTKRPTVTRKLSKTKLEQEFLKFSREDQAEFLNLMKFQMSCDVMANVTISNEIQSVLSSSSSSMSAVVTNFVAPTILSTLKVGGKSSKSITSTPVSEEAQLCNLRQELGEVLSREAECRSREKRIRTSIKKLQRKVSIRLIGESSRSIDDSTLRLVQEENTALSKTFLIVKYAASVVSGGLRRVPQICPLWRLAALTGDEEFEQQMISRRLEDRKEAVLVVSEHRSLVSLSHSYL